ncbi:MAG: hypothetical protein EBZ59_10600 [Planctomycetia bacterium]|nr:hypothetical protein [Planctomycetia bacterium]
MSSKPPATVPQGSASLGWLWLWVAVVAAAMLLPAVALARHQWLSRHRERLSWDTILDPALPDPGQPPAEDVPIGSARRVSIGFYLSGMGDLSIQQSRWNAVIDVWCRWRDDEPGAVQGEAFDPFDRLIAVGGTIEHRELLQRIDDGASHYELQRLGVCFTKVFRTVNFPLDEHLLVASFENSAYPRQRLVFVPDVEATAVSSRVTMAGRRIRAMHAVENPHSYRTSRGMPGVPASKRATFSQPRFAVVVERADWGPFAKMFQAMFVAVAVSLLSCFVRPIHVDPRFGLGVGALFAAVANGYLVNAAMPEGGEFALADVVTLLGIFTILVTLAESTISLAIYDSFGRPAVSRRLDRVSFVVILACFVVALALLLAGATLPA